MDASGKINNVLCHVSMFFEDGTAENVRELLSAGEPGVALETLCTQLVEYRIPISMSDKRMLVSAAEQMNISIVGIEDMSSD